MLIVFSAACNELVFGTCLFICQSCLNQKITMELLRLLIELLPATTNILMLNVNYDITALLRQLLTILLITALRP